MTTKVSTMNKSNVYIDYSISSIKDKINKQKKKTVLGYYIGLGRIISS